ncbi:hypothetical protein B566_EDAN006540 [Ephemera danica]|nr:hypothetical protein B566_EDAN006540 [Ephemera danica]
MKHIPALIIFSLTLVVHSVISQQLRPTLRPDQQRPGVFGDDRSRQGNVGDERTRQGTFGDDGTRQGTFGDDRTRQGTFEEDRTRQSGFGNDRSRPIFGSGDRRGGGFNDDRPRTSGINDNNVYIDDASYFIVASKIVRPGQLYRVAVTVLRSNLPVNVRVTMQRDGVEISAARRDVSLGITETIALRVPATSVAGRYHLRVEGTLDDMLGGIAFRNETELFFSPRSMTIFIQTDKPVYMQGQTVRFRTVPITTELKAFSDAVDIFMLDPQRTIMKRWLSRQSNLGTVSLNYQLSDQPVFGDWTIQVVAQSQIEEATFTVTEYYQTRFEVRFCSREANKESDGYIYGTVMANYTSGAPVYGNLTLKATLTPIMTAVPGRPQQRPGFPPYDNFNTNNNNINNATIRPQQQFRPVNNLQDRDRDRLYRQRPIEKFFTFKEDFPFWYHQPVVVDDEVEVPQLKHFYGVHHFRYPLRDLAQFVPQISGMEVKITASVGDRFLDEIVTGFSTARIYNSSLKVAFLGGSPQVFRPAMPLHCYLAVSYHDNSPLDEERLKRSRMEISAEVILRSGGRRNLETQLVKMSTENPGIYTLKVDLKSQLGGEETSERRLRELLKDVASLRLLANFKDADEGHRASAELLAITHYSPNNQHLRVYTSTKEAKVGEYLILHVQSNALLESFSYVVVSKGLVLYAGQERMLSTVHTLALTLSPEMAPAATVLVYQPTTRGVTLADALTFPVDGISRNNSLHQMALFDSEVEGSSPHTHAWLSHEGNPDRLQFFPAGSRGVDANSTFELAGLVVFSDRMLPARPSNCNATLGWLPCMSGQGSRSGGCYRKTAKCDGRRDCEDGTDESNCPMLQAIAVEELRKFRSTRFSLTQRQLDNVWLWQDVNIGPHGRYLFNIPVPSVPAHWTVSAFGVSPTVGYGVLPEAIEYVGVLPFSMIVEMPKKSRQGEQVGIRVAVFNYQPVDIEATVVLSSSKDYKFVHVEEDGFVRSYNPRTSHGEHQFFVFIRAQDAAVVMIPIVPTRLGDISVTIHAATLMGKDQVTRKLTVEADGLPQYRHHSILLDLSNRAYVFQYLHVNVTETPIIPYDEDRYYIYGSNKATISIVGDVVGPIFPTMPVNSTSLLHLPMDSAEQNMFGFAANLYTTMYMRLINQRNRSLERDSFHHLNVGYQRQLSFRNPDGSFSLFRSDWNHSSPSVWLTAYCARIFQEATFYEWENFIYIDPEVINSAVYYVLQHQTPEGSFWEVTWSPDRKANSSLNWPRNETISQRNVTLTAHVLIMLDTVKDLPGGLGGAVALAQKQAVEWLERNLRLIEKHGKPYDIALVAYALLLSQSSKAETAFGLLDRHAIVDGGYRYWGREPVPLPPSKIENQKPFLLPRLPYKYDSENIEATAWALMSYTARQELMFIIDPIVKWLNSQRLYDGGWASTQDTATAMKALVEYTIRQRLRDVSTLTVTVEATALPGQTKTLRVNENNWATLQKIEIPEAWGTVKVQAKGAGYAILQMTVQYNVDIPKFQTQPPMKAFELRTHALFHGRNQSHITYHCCQRWTLEEESPRSGLAVLEVAVPTGYIVQQQNLDAYVRWLSYQAQLDHFTSNIRPLDKHETCINFTLERWYPVANMSRYLPIRVYDYYAPERFNETIFDAISTYVLNICEVCGSSQCPYCPIYNVAFHLIPPSLGLLVFCALLQIVRGRLLT